jgi:hypothetical protein
VAGTAAAWASSRTTNSRVEIKAFIVQMHPLAFLLYGVGSVRHTQVQHWMQQHLYKEIDAWIIAGNDQPEARPTPRTQLIQGSPVAGRRQLGEHLQ